MNAWTIYWVMIADSICDVLGFFALVGGCGLMFLVAWHVLDQKKPLNGYHKTALWLYFVVLLPAATLMPTTKTLAAMYVLPRIAESEAIQKDLPEIWDLGVSALKQQFAKEYEDTKGKVKE